jgi:hypothetical protein
VKDLDNALAEIAAIRSQLALAVEFHGYGPLTVASTGAFAIAAAAFQQFVLPPAAHAPAQFVATWMVVAVVAVILIGIEMAMRSRVMHSGQAQEMIVQAAEQLVPSGVAGLLLTVVILHRVPQVAGMLPGLWQILLGLGACASARFLPRPILLVGAWYVVSGLVVVALFSNGAMPSPWTMGIPFGVGQLVAAGILQWSESGNNGESEQA